MNEIINAYALNNMKPETLLKKIKENMGFLKSIGYSQEEVIKMTKSLPAIYSHSIENMKQKIEFYDSIGLHKLPVISPKDLMQSTALSYARYMFYKDKGIQIDETNLRKLFIRQKQFETQYGITKQELLEKYDYTEYVKQKSLREAGKKTGTVPGGATQSDDDAR